MRGRFLNASGRNCKRNWCCCWPSEHFASTNLARCHATRELRLCSSAACQLLRPPPRLQNIACEAECHVAPRSNFKPDIYHRSNIVQQIVRGRTCGFGDKDRRPLTPPLVVKLSVFAASGEELPAQSQDISNLVLAADLTEGSMVQVPTNPTRASSSAEEGQGRTSVRNLVGKPLSCCVVAFHSSELRQVNCKLVRIA